MSSLASKLGGLLPEGNAKNTIRLAAFKVLFATAGTHHVELGTANDKITAAIGRLIFTRESLGEREIEGYLQHYQPKTGDTVINAGAYHGYFALYLADKVGPTGRVICFEPEPNNLKLLRRNLQANNVDNVTVIPKGLWSANTTLPLISRGSGSSIESTSRWDKQTTPVCTLDRELERLNINRVNLITMDIEGAELQAVKGISKTVRSNPDLHLAIASYHRVDGQQTCHRVEQLLTDQGLHAVTAYPRHLTTYAWHRNPK